ncbi:hypothetical protein, partial [Tannerella forsythia]|uniref:hypothetical protein n=1 Tax=Tannerella forsythia TaxID=28112 RepID=UPI001C890ABF
NTMPFSPTLRIGLNDLALSGLLQQSAFSRPTTQQINISTTQHPKSIQGLKARIISAPSRKGRVSTSGPCSQG